MKQPDRRRHIKDIAHLYLSRLEQPKTGASLTVLVAGAHRDTHPAFHASNLAAALAKQTSARVDLVDVSGLLPNSGYYLSLAPNIYLSSRTIPERAGMGGVELSFAVGQMLTPGAGGASIGGRTTDSTGIRVIHIPPMEFSEPFIRGRNMAIASIDQGTVALLCVGFPSRQSIRRLPAGIAVFRLAVDQGPGTDVANVVDLGVLTDWRSAVADRLPAVIRDTRTPLARSYLSISDAIMARSGSNQRRRNEGKGRPSDRQRKSAR